MTSLATVDIVIIIAYFVLTLVVGLVMSRKASRGLNEYFLGGRSIPWYLLGIAGMGNWFDLTGTMIITSFLFMLGPQGLFIEFRGGAVLVLAFMIAYTGKWHRRSGCMTSGEWMSYRFGTGTAAGWMRVFTAVRWVVFTAGMLAYLVRGTSLFVGQFVPYPPLAVTAVLLAVSGLYTVISGFYGVVVTDLIQGLIKMAACLVIAFIAFSLFSSEAGVGALAAKVTGNADWTVSAPQWHATMPRGYEAYESLVLFASFYLLRNVLTGLGSGAETRYFGAKSDRDCGLLSMLQGVTVAFRWPLMMGFAVLGLVLVGRLFPDRSAVEQASAAIHRYYPDIAASNWHDATANVMHRPEVAPAGLVPELQHILGDNWRAKLSLVGSNGTVNPEQVLPAVIAHSVPAGLRGFILVAMLAATMSTLAGWVNQGGAFVVRDLYQFLWRPRAKERELVICSYVSTATLLIVSFWLGVHAQSINHLWGWLMMGLAAGTLAPELLRLYWWRCNAWGVVVGTALGGAGAIVQRVVAPELVEWKQFLVAGTLSFAGTIIVSLLTAPTERATLRHFYRTTRPFGWWRPLRAELAPAERTAWKAEHRNDILSVPFLLVAQITLFLLPMQLVIHAYGSFVTTLPIFVVAASGAYWFWWRNLPSAENPGTATATQSAQVTPDELVVTNTVKPAAGGRL